MDVPLGLTRFAMPHKVSSARTVTLVCAAALVLFARELLADGIDAGVNDRGAGLVVVLFDGLTGGVSGTVTGLIARAGAAE